MTLRIEKVLNGLPVTLTPDTLYMVRNNDSTVTLFVSDSGGTTALEVSGGATSTGEIDPFLLMGAM